jgi:hypothetical protein
VPGSAAEIKRQLRVTRCLPLQESPHRRLEDARHERQPLGGEIAVSETVNAAFQVRPGG